MQAAAHIPSEIRDAPRPTKDGSFDLAGGRWFARDQANHAKVVRLIQQHVGPQKRVVVDGTCRCPAHAPKFVVYGKVFVEQDWFDQ